MRFKNIEVGKWYYVRWFEHIQPHTAYKMKVIQKYKRNTIIVMEKILRKPIIVKPKQVLAEVLIGNEIDNL